MEKNFWQGKRVTAYVALKHHTRFIIPIMERLAELGADTRYLVAQAERSQEITAIETGLDYRHIFDFIRPQDKEAIFDHYHMLRDTFKHALLEHAYFSAQVPTVLDKTLFNLAQEYTGFKNYVQWETPDICLSLHELNRWGKTFSFHAKQQKIPHIILQEGLLTSAAEDMTFVLTGHVQNSTLCLVWGENSRKKLADFEAPKDRIIPAGNTHLANEIKQIAQNRVRKQKRRYYKSKNKFVAILFFSINLPRTIDEFLPLISLPLEDSSIDLFIKYHPGTSQLTINEWVKRFPASAMDKIHNIHGQEDTYALMAMSDLCILAEASTVGLEALALGRPLVLLNLEAEVVYKDTSLVENKAALNLTVTELCSKLRSKSDFIQQIDPTGVNKYLENELIDTQNSIDRVVQIMGKTVQASQAERPTPLLPEKKSNRDWTLVLPVTLDPEAFLATLENITLSSGNEDYEVILITPPVIPQKIKIILDSLEGDLTILDNPLDLPLATMMNRAAQKAAGEMILFLDDFIAPTPGWFSVLKTGWKTYGKDIVFGGKIINRYENIVHAGIVVNTNSQPVSAYLHLDRKFIAACKTRPFQMIDLSAGMTREFFLNSGGFHPHAGRYKYLDFCLRIGEKKSRDHAVVYLNDLGLIQLSPSPVFSSYNDAVYFYGRWNSQLWHSEEALYKGDGISALQLSAARMTRAQETANRL